jgi:hypothetical protein
MPRFNSVLYLDDMRTPRAEGFDVVRNFDEFVEHLKKYDMPDLISFDHDLSFEQYPTEANVEGMLIDYDSYKEKTGLHCARYIIDNGLDLKFWNVHSFNVQGRINIGNALRPYRPRHETHLDIPFFIAPLI